MHKEVADLAFKILIELY